MDYLYKKADGSATSLNGTVTRLQLPNQTGGDVVFPGDQRPVDLGDYVLVKSIDVVQEVTATKKRGGTTVEIDTDAVTVTVTQTAVDKSDEEKWLEIRTKRDKLISNSDWMAMPDSPAISDAWTTYRAALRALPASQTDPDDITFPDPPS
jgi:hypothetical protein|tara:strand:- start:72 stop:521 length:450 start_codon:yes stop_codon:yes gene_type:complete